MAMTYQNFASLGVNLNRQKYGPLDISNVFTSDADLKYYLTKGTFTEGVSEYWYKNENEKVVPYPYEGQVLATVINGVVSVYALSLDAEGNFQTQEIGAKIETDDKTIKLVDGKLELVGLPEVTSGKTFVPSLINGVLTWAEPDTSTAEGQQQAIDGLTTRVSTIETVLNGSEDYNPKEDGPYNGLIDGVAYVHDVTMDLEYQITDETKERNRAISNALQAAKDYADAQDADTIYDDTDLQNRVKTIEDNYLTEADKYDDTALTNRVTAVEGAASDNATAIATEKDRAEAAEAGLASRIDGIVTDQQLVTETDLSKTLGDYATKKYVSDEISDIYNHISDLNHFTTEVIDEVTLNNYLDTPAKASRGVLYLVKDETVTGVDKYNEYILVGAEGDNLEFILIGDTTTDLSNYYNKDEIDQIEQGLSNRINSLVENDDDHVSRIVELEDNYQSVQEELAAYKLEVTSDIATAKSEAIADADAKLANKVAISDFNTFKTENTTAIATAKQEAINAAAAAEEAKGYAVSTEVATTYATKTELGEAVSNIENDLLAYAKTSDVTAELAKKIDKATISHSTDEKAEGATVNGTQLDIVVDAFTKAETRQYVADTITSFTGGESAKDVLLALNNYKSDNDARVGAIETTNGEQDTAIAAAQSDATKALTNAANNAAAIQTANGLIADNTREIGVAKDSINTVNNTLTEKITALETKDTQFTTDITALQITVVGHTTTITQQGTAISALQDKDTELAALIQANTDKFANYYTTTQVDAKVQEAIDAIPDVDFTPYVTKDEADDTYATITALEGVSGELTAEIARAQAAEQKIADELALLIENPTEALDSVKELIEHVQANGTAVAGIITRLDGHDTAIAKNAEDIAALTSAVNAIVQPKASKEVTVAEDGTLGLGEVSTDKLVQGSDILVLDGGSAV